MPVLEKELHIAAPIDEVYAVWRDFQRFAEYLGDVKSITLEDATTSHWVVMAPFNTSVEFTATIQEHRPNEYLRWESFHGAGVEIVRSGGELFFQEADGGTDVRLRFSYELPSDSAQRVVDTLKVLGYPDRAFDTNLQRIKERLEG